MPKQPLIVIAGLDPAIHSVAVADDGVERRPGSGDLYHRLNASPETRLAWIAGSSPAMTSKEAEGAGARGASRR